MLELAEKFVNSDTREMSEEEQEQLFEAMQKRLSDEEFYNAVVLPHMPRQVIFKSRMAPDEIKNLFRKVILLLAGTRDQVHTEAAAQNGTPPRRKKRSSGASRGLRTMPGTGGSGILGPF